MAAKAVEDNDGARNAFFIKKKKLNKKHAYSPTESLHCPGDEGLLVL